MKVYKYTIDSVGGITTKIKDLPNRIEFNTDAKFIQIVNPDGSTIMLPMCNVVRIIEEEAEI